ncbi:MULTISPECIES: hypothetical protein [unclassified Cryobacterium]|uniref:hypothetical protein n=1 Tax=unclassified Cryobacterium TaxID=2649013 RepID=UPI001069296A|nr:MULTISPECIES: hypothetical protein [unclassified Cryobacterium]TFD03671.1 hypothetical protein E3T29_17825 [Cryobacterium sp. TMT1-66-1]TFD12977.1 hypothetical protein E3T35_06780 [Cryobacterium sp. TMT1-2-2]
MTEETPSALEKISLDAQQAWDEGQSFYAPTFIDLRDGGIKWILEDFTEPMGMVGRNVEWESALAKIAATGWKLTSWSVQTSVSTGQLPISTTRAFAMFIRG